MNDKKQDKKNPSNQTSRNETGRKDDSKKTPASEPGRKDSPKRHEEAPGRNPAPSRSTVDDSGRGRRQPEGENPDEEG
jgi:hypothetical protein